MFALFRSCLPVLFVSFFFSPRSSLVVCYFTFYFVLGLFLLCFCCCFVRSPKGFLALLVSYWPYFVSWPGILHCALLLLLAEPYRFSCSRRELIGLILSHGLLFCNFCFSVCPKFFLALTVRVRERIVSLLVVLRMLLLLF